MISYSNLIVLTVVTRLILKWNTKMGAMLCTIYISMLYTIRIVFDQILNMWLKVRIANGY